MTPQKPRDNSCDPPRFRSQVQHGTPTIEFKQYKPRLINTPQDTFGDHRIFMASGLRPQKMLSALADVPTQARDRKGDGAGCGLQ